MHTAAVAHAIAVAEHATPLLSPGAVAAEQARLRSSLGGVSVRRLAGGRRGERVQAPCDLDVYVRRLAAELRCVVRYIDQRVVTFKRHLVGCNPLRGPIVLSVVKSDHTPEPPA